MATELPRGMRSRVMPAAPLTRNQVALMEIDTMASANQPGFAELKISPRPIEETLQEIIRSSQGTQDDDAA